MFKMRNSIMLFDDQWNLVKELKSKKLLWAFCEYMFEDIEPKNLNNLEEILFKSLEKRMQKVKQKHDGNSLGWQKSSKHWIGSKTSSDLDHKCKSTISQPQVNDNEEEGILSYDNIQEEVKETNKEKVQLDEFIEKWNWIKTIHTPKWNVAWLKQCRWATEDMEKLWSKIVKSYTREQISEWVNNYIEEIKKRDNNSSYYSHRFTLYEFIKQGNWLKKFINNI